MVCLLVMFVGSRVVVSHKKPLAYVASCGFGLGCLVLVVWQMRFCNAIAGVGSYSALDGWQRYNYLLALVVELS